MPRPRDITATAYTGTSGTIGSTTIALFGGDDDDATSTAGSLVSSVSNSVDNEVKGMSTTTIGLIIGISLTAALFFGWLAVHYYRKRKLLAPRAEAKAAAAGS